MVEGSVAAVVEVVSQAIEVPFGFNFSNSKIVTGLLGSCL